MALQSLDGCRWSEPEAEWRFHDSLRGAFASQSELLRPVFEEVSALRRRHGRRYDEAARPAVDPALEELLAVRVSCRFLMQHALQAASPSANARRAGALEFPCDLHRLTRDAGRDAAGLCAAALGQAPAVEASRPPEGVEVLCAPASLRYALLEVLKNACRATVERHGGSGFDDLLPPVRCSYRADAERLTLTVADDGGGLSSARLRQVWGFAFSTAAESPWDREAGPVLAGFGVGLPVSRTYMRYFGGDLVLESEPGAGARARLQLSLREDCCERLPTALS